MIVKYQDTYYTFDSVSKLYCRPCPCCKIMIQSSSVSNVRASIRQRRTCVSCMAETYRRFDPNDKIRACPSCSVDIKYKAAAGKRSADQNKSICQSCVNKNRVFSESTREKMRNAKLGKKLSDSHCAKISSGLANGRAAKPWKNKKQPADMVRKRVASRHGYSHSETTKSKIGQSNALAWASKRPQASNQRATKGQLRTWSRAVLKQDAYVCQICFTDKQLEAHHILSKFKHPDFELVLLNGIALCSTCHKYEHKINGLM
jgi:5-methylcytosine-specific restriction endonuclease McrA